MRPLTELWIHPHCTRRLRPRQKEILDKIDDDAVVFKLRKGNLLRRRDSVVAKSVICFFDVKFVPRIPMAPSMRTNSSTNHIEA